MAKRRMVRLSGEQRAELTAMRDQHAKAYLRERAAAILKVANGQSVRQVAQHGLLKRREPETVSGWIDRYQQQGLDGLLVKAGRGRKPVFFPSHARTGPG